MTIPLGDIAMTHFKALKILVKRLRDHMEMAGFTRMRDGSADEYVFLDTLDEAYAKARPQRIEAKLQQLEHSLCGYRDSRLQHSLQSAARVHRYRRPVDHVVAALVHDIGDEAELAQPESAMT